MRHEARLSVCDAFRPRLGELAAGALAGREVGRVRGHAAGCPECTARLASLERVGRMLDGVGLEAPPSDLWAGIAPRLKPRRSQWAPRLAWAVGMATAVAVLVIALAHCAPSPLGRRPQVVAGLQSTAPYDVVRISDMSDDAATVGLYARSAAQGDWLDPAAAAVYLGSAGKDAGL